MKTIFRMLLLAGLVGFGFTFLHRYFGFADLIAFGAVTALVGFTFLEYVYPRRFIRLEKRAPRTNPSGDNRAANSSPPDDRMAA